jgi:hypothetical protein
MNPRVSLTAVFFIAFLSCQGAGDSTQQKQRVWLITPRFNTLNMAPVSGNIVNRHVNVDVTLVYTNNKFRWTTQNAVDFEDGHSDMNYFLSNVRYKIDLTRHFGISPFLAFYSEHAHQIIDPISDLNAGLIFTYSLKFLTIEGFFLFVRLTHENPNKDVINRFEIKYAFKSIVLSGFAYINTGYFDEKESIAVGFRAVLPEVQLFDKLTARSEVTGSFRLHENPATTNLSGVFLSLAFPVYLGTR